MELWNRNIYTDLNGKSQNLETKQIKRHGFSYVYLCLFNNSDIFNDTLRPIATFKLSWSRQKSQKNKNKKKKKNVFCERGDNSYVGSNFEMHFIMVI